MGVYVSYTNNPYDFVINLESSRNAYELLKNKMKNFYSTKGNSYLVKEPTKDYVYVCRNNENDEYTRIKFIDYFAGENARIYDIDAGNFAAIKTIRNQSKTFKHYIYSRSMVIPSKSLFYFIS